MTDNDYGPDLTPLLKATAKHGRRSPIVARLACHLFAPYRATQLVEDGRVVFPIDARTPWWMLPYDGYFGGDGYEVDDD